MSINIGYLQYGWIQQPSGNNNNFFDSYFYNSNTGWLVGSQAMILKTTNGGVNWVNKSLTVTQFTFTGVFFVDSLTGWICGGNPYPFNIMLKTIDGGNNWIMQNPSINYLLWGVYFVDKLTGWACGWNGTIMKTTNGGTNWFNQLSQTTNELYRVKFVNLNTGFVVGTYGDIIKTTDGGSNWVHYPLGSNTWLRWIDFPSSIPSASTGWITGNNGVILKTLTVGMSSLLAPELISPENYSTDIALSPTLLWNSVPYASNYKVQISPVPNFSVIKDSALVSGTQYKIPIGKLNYSTTYFWRVKASNSGIEGPWSDIWLFSTVINSGISKYDSKITGEFKLYNNYPNPFNPETKIKFDIPFVTNVSLKIYDALGSEKMEILNKELNAGKYEFTLNAGKFTSGIYFYVLSTDKYKETKRMILLK